MKAKHNADFKSLIGSQNSLYNLVLLLASECNPEHSAQSIWKESIFSGVLILLIWGKWSQKYHSVCLLKHAAWFLSLLTHLLRRGLNKVKIWYVTQQLIDFSTLGWQPVLSTRGGGVIYSEAYFVLQSLTHQLNSLAANETTRPPRTVVLHSTEGVSV